MSSFLCLIEFAWGAVRSWAFVCREVLFFLIAHSVSLQVIGLFKVCCFFLIQFWWPVMFVEIYSFLPGCSVCQYIIVHSVFLCGFFVFLQYQWWFLLFHISLCLSDSSLFSSWWDWLEVCQSYLFFQRNSPCFYWFLLFLVPTLFPLWSLLFSSFFWFWVLFFLLFLILEEGVHHYELPSKNCFYCIL